MSIFATAVKASLPPDPKSLVEGAVTSNITSGITFGSDPARTLKTTVNNVLGVDSTTASTLGPNFDRFSVLKDPQSFGVVGNLFQSGQDLVPIARIASNFGGTFIGNELTQINVANLLQNPGTELSTFAKNLSNSVSNQVQQQGKSLARSVVQDLKDVFRGAVNSLLDPAAAKTTNLGVVDSRLSYAFYGPIDANKNYSKGQPQQTPTTSAPSVGPAFPPPAKPIGFKGVEPITNPHYVFRLNTVANGMSSGDEGEAQSRLLLDKESRMGVGKVGKKEVTLSALLSKFGGFSQSNPTPYRAADFLWLKYYNRIPLTRQITLRRYMFPIQDNLTRSPYLGGGTSTRGSWRIKGWGNNPISQMVTYFGGESGNDLSSIIKIAVSTKWSSTADSKVNDIQLFSGQPVDAITMFDSSRVAKLTAAAAKTALALPAGAAASVLGGAGIKGAEFFNSIKNIASQAGIGPRELAAGVLAYGGVIDKSRFAGISSYLDLFNPYSQGGYLSDLYREPYNRIMSVQKRDTGLSGGIMGDGSVNIKFEYSLKAIGHINAKAAMLDIMANILATTHYRGNFWGGEARFYLNKGLFPLLDEKQTIEFVKMIWSGDFDGATQKFESIIKDAFGGELPTVDAIKGLLALRDAGTKTPSRGQAQADVIGSANINPSATQLAAISGGNIPDRLKDIASIDLLAGLFGLTDANGNASIPSFQALRTGAPVGEWHLTVGNPFKPIAVIGNLICEGVDISFNNELGSDDFPTEMTATVKLKPGMSRANQDVESIFNDGFGALYIPKPDLFEGGKGLEQVQEEISKQVARSGIFDFMGLVPDSTVESLSNFYKIGSNTDTILPTPHVTRPQTETINKKFER